MVSKELLFNFPQSPQQRNKVKVDTENRNLPSAPSMTHLYKKRKLNDKWHMERYEKLAKNLQKSFFPIIKLKYLLTDDNSPETETIYKNNIKVKKYNLN